MKRFLVLFAVLLSVLCIVVSASGVIQITGTCGDNITWVLSPGGILTVTGSGDMYNNCDFAAVQSRYDIPIIKVVISNGVTSIGNSAFRKCTALNSVTIPDSVTYIGHSAFQDCTSLEGIRLPSELFEIGSNVFNGTAVEELTVPEKLVRIHYHAFEGMKSLKKVIWNAVNSDRYNPSITTGDGLFVGSGSDEGFTVIFSEGVEHIPSYIFRECPNLISVTIPESVTEIGQGAFIWCDRLETVYYNAIEAALVGSENFSKAGSASGMKVIFGDNVASVPGNLFISSNLSEIEFSDSITEIGGYAFYGCKLLTSAIIPDSVTSIGYSAFQSCTALSSVKLPSELFEIGSNVFNGTAVEELTVPEKLVRIHYHAFDGMKSLKKVIWNAVNSERYNPSISAGNGLFVGSGSDEGFTAIFSEGVEHIPSCIFHGCPNLTSVTIPESVTEIGQGEFIRCDRLETVYYNAIEAALVGSEPFSKAGSASGMKVIFGENVASVPRNLFISSNLSEIEFSDSITEIGGYAFYGCKLLTSAIIPDSVTSIGDSAFNGCTSLTIYCYENSYAHKYAEDESIRYELILPFDVVGTSLVLDSQIGLKVYFYIDSEKVKLSTVRFSATKVDSDYKTDSTSESYKSLYMVSGYSTVDHGEEWMTKLTYDEATGFYYIILSVAPKDADNVRFTNGIRYTLADGTAETASIDTRLSVPQYISEAKALAAEGNAEFIKALSLVEKIERYSDYADNFFNEGGLEAYTSSAAVTAENASRSEDTEDIKFHSTSLILEEKITVRHYFTVRDVEAFAENYSANREYGTKGGLVYFDITDIAPDEIGTLQNLTVRDTNGNEVYTLDYSVANYIVSSLSSADSRLVSLMNALYDYYLSAKSYAEQ